jgi:hypothetical protein
MMRHFDRRRFLAGAGCLVGAGVLATRASWQALTGRVRRSAGTLPTPRRAVFREMPYFSFDGTGEVYEQPAGNRGTRDYVDRIGAEEFLRRHWFA